MGAGHDRRALAAAALAAAAAHAGPALCRYSPALRRALGVRDRGTDPGAVALTFDDGPHSRGTPATLEVLRAEQVRATFFVVGEQVERHRSVAAEIVAAGHTLGVHGYRHRNLLRLTPAQVRDDLVRAEAALAAVTHVPPSLYRPPYGVLSTGALTHARRRGWTPLLWTHWGRDWRARATAATIADEATARLTGADVILLHDADHYSATASWERMVAALPRIIDRIAGAGMRFATAASASQPSLMPQAISPAQTAASGALNEIDVALLHGRLVFNVDVGNQDVTVDATTGQVATVDQDD
jgi:peptidoglycan/xylan/chitin deacetylase (PgdA/CDA1 family)